MFKNNNRKAIRREFLFLKTQKLRSMLKLEIINKNTKIKNHEEEAEIKVNIINKIQVKEKLDMFRSRKMLLKVPNLIKMDISRLRRVVISPLNLINLIVGASIEVDNKIVEFMKGVVVVMKMVVVDTKVVVEVMNVVVEVMNVVVEVMKVVVEVIMIIIVITNNSKILGKEMRIMKKMKINKQSLRNKFWTMVRLKHLNSQLISRGINQR